MESPKKGDGGMNEETKRTDNDVYHERANYEDILHTRRLGLFLTFNSFLAVAVGLLDDNPPKIVFAVVALLLDVFWILWSRNAGVFIRKLRDAGNSRVDQVLWGNEISKMDKRFWGFIAPLNIMNYWLPGFLIGGWVAILIYFAQKI
jgi:hypothetical protein